MSSAPEGSLLERTVDKVVSLVSPQRAYTRRHFRLMDRDADYRSTIESALEKRGYRKRASSAGGEKKSLAHVGQIGHDPRGADSVLLAELRLQRSKSRALRRENALAAGLINGTAREIVGTGIMPQSLATGDQGETPLRDVLEAVFAERAPHLFPAELGGLREVQRILVEKLLEDGGVLVKPAATDEQEPVWFELVEIDRCSWPTDARPQDEGGSIRDGVERDRHGRIVAYWISKWHPGDVAVPYSTPPGKHVPLSARDFERIPKESIRHLALTSRPGQSHGTPWLTPVSEELSRLDLLLRSSLERVTMAACLAVFIETSVELDGIVSATAQEYGFELDQDIRPGMFFRLAPGEEVKHISPNFPVGDIETFTKVLSRRIGTALGLSYLAVSFDASGYNYSSARTDLIRDRRLYRSHQRQLVDEVLTWLWVTVLEDARLRGDPRMRGVTDEEIHSVSYTLPTQEWVDPKNEVGAVEAKLALNLTTLRDEAAALGRDYEDLVRQRAMERALEAKVAAEHLGTAATATAGGEGGAVEDAAMNGAQIASLKEIVQDVSSGALPGLSAKALIAASFPSLSAESVAAIVDPADPRAAAPKLAA